MFSDVNMKKCGCCNVSKHRVIKFSDRCITLDISLKFDSLDKMKITSSYSKYNLGGSGKELITYLGLKAKVRSHKYRRSRYAIINVSKNDLSKIIGDFEKLPYESYEKKSPKHEPTDRYFYPVIQLVNCMMRADALNLRGYPVRTEMTATKQIPTRHVCSTDESELKEFPVNKTLLWSCSADEDKSKGIIVNKCSTEEGELKCIINKQKDANNGTDYEESSVTDEVPIYLNIFESCRKLLNRINLTYE